MFVEAKIEIITRNEILTMITAKVLICNAPKIRYVYDLLQQKRIQLFPRGSSILGAK